MSNREFKLLPSQLKALQSQEKVTLLLCSRGTGKSYGAGFYCIARLLSDANVGMLICPIYSMLRDTTSYILKHLEKLGIEYTINKKPHWCNSTLSDHKGVLSINNGTSTHKFLFLNSADEPDHLRGKSIDFAVLDEAAIMDESVIDIITPALRANPLGAHYNYRILLATTSTTVNNWIYKRYIEPGNVSNFKEIKALAEENFYEYTPEKIESIRQQMTDIMFRREMLCEWISISSNSVFYAFDRARHLKSLEDTSQGKFFMSADMNVDGLTSIVSLVNGNNIHIDNEVVIKENGNAQKMASEFHKLYALRSNKALYLTGDRNLKSRNAAASSTYHQQLINELRRLGWQVTDKTLNANPSVWDSSEITNRKLELNELTIDPRCKVLIDDLTRGVWKENLGDKFEINKAICRSDASDCLRYLVWEFRPGNRIVASNSFFK